MSEITARFRQSPVEERRYLLDYTLELQPSELITNVTATVSSPSGADPATFSITNITVASDGLQAFFYASEGTNLASYEVAFLATTSLNQVFEDVVAFDIQEKT